MRTKGRLPFAGIVAALLLTALFVFGGGEPRASAMLPESLSGHKVAALSDGKPADLGELSQGRPFYIVFSTPT